MKNILVAGAGHGGLSAAAILAKNGFSVTVLEKSAREEIGHDWCDAMELPAMTFAEIPIFPEDKFVRGLHMCFYNPKKTVKLTLPPDPDDSDCITIDRKYLINYLISHCENCGVKFIFNTNIISAITDSERVCGVKAEENGIEKEYFADMVIDAAGMNSPVRRSLPDSFGIQKEFDSSDIFDTYRVYFDNPNKYISEPDYSVFFFNCNKPGIDWVITYENQMDILIGKFGELTDEEIKTSLADLRKAYPDMSTDIVRGGKKTPIPLAKTLSMLVANSYALIGDSAGMTVPLNGSGITLSIKAGKLLACAVINAEKYGYTKKSLWQYQYRYFNLFGNSLVAISILRRFFSVISADDVDFFLEKKIITEKEIGMSGGNLSGVNAPYVTDKLIAALPKAKLLPQLLSIAKQIPTLNSVFSLMPPEWDDKKVKKWEEKYKEL